MANRKLTIQINNMTMGTYKMQYFIFVHRLILLHIKL